MTRLQLLISNQQLLAAAGVYAPQVHKHLQHAPKASEQAHVPGQPAFTNPNSDIQGNKQAISHESCRPHLQKYHDTSVPGTTHPTTLELGIKPKAALPVSYIPVLFIFTFRQGLSC